MCPVLIIMNWDLSHINLKGNTEKRTICLNNRHDLICIVIFTRACSPNRQISVIKAWCGRCKCAQLYSQRSMVSDNMLELFHTEGNAHRACWLVWTWLKNSFPSCISLNDQYYISDLCMAQIFKKHKFNNRNGPHSQRINHLTSKCKLWEKTCTK